MFSFVNIDVPFHSAFLLFWWYAHKVRVRGVCYFFAVKKTEYFQRSENTECVQTSRDTYVFKVVGILNFQFTLLD